MTITVTHQGRRWEKHKGWTNWYWKSDKGNYVTSLRLTKRLDKLAIAALKAFKSAGTR